MKKLLEALKNKELYVPDLVGGEIVSTKLENNDRLTVYIEIGNEIYSWCVKTNFNLVGE